MYRRPEQRGARRPGARALARRLHHENPRKIGRLRRYHRLRPDRRRSVRRASLRNPARHRARHSAPRRHLRQRLRQQGQSGRRESARHRSGHPPQGERKEQAGLLRTHPLQGPRTHRAGRRTAQALQARRAPMRKDRTKLQINRQLRRRPLLDQIRPHDLRTSLHQQGLTQIELLTWSSARHIPGQQTEQNVCTRAASSSSGAPRAAKPRRPAGDEYPQRLKSHWRPDSKNRCIVWRRRSANTGKRSRGRRPTCSPRARIDRSSPL